MKKKFKLGQFVFELNYTERLPIPENLLRFESEDETADYFYEVEFVNRFPPITGVILANREDLLVLEKNGLENRYIGLKGENYYYACSQELDSTLTRVLLSEGYIDNYRVDPIFSSLLSLEKHLIIHNSLLLHCAYMNHNGRAILFSAPSETGKTTQANLWAKYRGTDQVNGDRALLRCVDGEWHACGWPVCGSSGICFNKEMPIEAIVMLSQAPTNSIERLHPMKAFSQVYSQVTINRWNNEAHNKAMGLIEQLITDVPVYHLACNISEDAVICLERAIGSVPVAP